MFFFLHPLWWTILLGIVVWAGISGLSELIEHLLRPFWFSESLLKTQVLFSWSAFVSDLVFFLLQLLILFPCSGHLVFGLLCVFIRILSRLRATWKRRQKDCKLCKWQVSPGRQHLLDTTELMHIRIHRDCDSSHKICTGSNQTTSQHWDVNFFPFDFSRQAFSVKQSWLSWISLCRPG